MKASLLKIEAKLLVATMTVGVIAAVVEGRFTFTGVATLLAMMVVVALGIGAGYRLVVARRKRLPPRI